MAGRTTEQNYSRTRNERKRIVTSCSECHRRKQRCNRLRPCNFCSARNLPERCRYGDEVFASDHTTLLPTFAQSLSFLSSSEHGVDTGLSAPPPSLLRQAGYSSLAQTGFLSHLQKVDSRELSGASVSTEHPMPLHLRDPYFHLVSQAPSDDIVLSLLDFYFSDANWSFPILDEHHFRNLHTVWRDKYRLSTKDKDVTQFGPDLLTFPALLFSVLAVALQFLPLMTSAARALNIHDFPTCDRVSQHFDTIGSKIMDLLGRQYPTTVSVQYDLSKGTWLKNSSRGSEAWQSLGSSIRQAQELDLHHLQDDIEQGPDGTVEKTLLRLWDLEHKKRLWARLFVLDSHMAMGLSKPRTIHREDFTTRAPLDCDYPKEPAKVIPLAINHSLQPPCSFTPTKFWIAISHKIHDMISIKAAKGQFNDYAKIQTLDNELHCLLDGLPPALRPKSADQSWDLVKPHLPAMRQRIATTASIFRLALHRPYVQTYVASRHAAIEAALDTLRIQQRLFGILDKPQYKLYGHSFYTLDAGIFLAAMAMEPAPTYFGLPEVVLHELQLAISRLTLMKERNTMAGTGELILGHFYQMILSDPQVSRNLGNSRGVLYNMPLAEVQPDMVNLLQNFGSRTPCDPAHQLVSRFLDTDYMPMDQMENTAVQDEYFSTFENTLALPLANENESISLESLPSEIYPKIHDTIDTVEVQHERS